MASRALGSARGSPAALRAPRRDLAWQQALTAAASPILAGLLFAALFIGERPFAVDAVDKAAATSGGSAFNRLVLFGGFALAVPLLLTHLGAAFRLLRRNLLAAAVVAWSTLSMLWATHPDLTLRRAVAFVLVYLALLGIVAARGQARDLLRPLTAVFVVITLMNVLVVVALPAASWSPIGENGIFDNKNTAGTMAMLATIVLGTAACAEPGRWRRPLLAGVALLAWWFLIETRSKTSLGVAFMMTALAPGLFILLALEPARRVLALLAAMAVMATGLTIAGAMGYGETDLRMALFGDLSFTGRTEIWSALMPELARRPWLGHGFGSFWDVGSLTNPIRSAPASAWFMNAQLINTAHNGFIDAWLQTGLIGLAIGCAAIARCLVLLLRAAAASAAGERWTMIGAFCVALALVLNNFLESYLFRTGDALGYLFIFMMLHADQARGRDGTAAREIEP